MKKQNFVAFGLLFLLTAISGFAQKKQPNIIFIISDSHRAEALGVAGNPFVQTPNLDQLAKRGTMFENAYVTTAICTGSRASFFSGQYMSRHQIEDFATDFSDEALAETFPLVLKKAGYKTGLIGTWGIGNNPPVSHFDHWDSKIPWRTPEGLHQTDHIVQKTVDYLESYSADAPFFLSIGFSAAHEIDPSQGNPARYEVQERFLPLYEDLKIPVPASATPEIWNGFPDFFRTDQNIARFRWEGFFSSPELFQENAKNYYRMVTGLDDAIGTIVSKLKELGMDENTVVIYTSDHGFSLNEHGLMGKWYPHEKSIRIPLIIYDPRNPDFQGKRSEKIALNIDVGPTLLRLAHLESPRRMQGIDLMEMLASNKRSLDRREFYYEHVFLGSPQLPVSHAVVRKDIKYIYYPEHDYEVVYDLNNDPEETENVADSSDFAKEIKKLRKSFKKLQQAAK
jgi:arylsulfatase A-like enzyme